MRSREGFDFGKTAIALAIALKSLPKGNPFALA
jgi:hypothetical protein